MRKYFATQEQQDEHDSANVRRTHPPISQVAVKDPPAQPVKAVSRTDAIEGEPVSLDDIVGPIKPEAFAPLSDEPSKSTHVIPKSKSQAKRTTAQRSAAAKAGAARRKAAKGSTT